MGVSGLFHTSVSLTQEKYFPLPTEGGSCLGHMAGADGLEKRKISCPRGDRATIRLSFRLYLSNYID
jgi:hypothetical protein